MLWDDQDLTVEVPTGLQQVRQQPSTGIIRNENIDIQTRVVGILRDVDMARGKLNVAPSVVRRMNTNTRSVMAERTEQCRRKGNTK